MRVYRPTSFFCADRLWNIKSIVPQIGSLFKPVQTLNTRGRTKHTMLDNQQDFFTQSKIRLRHRKRKTLIVLTVHFVEMTSLSSKSQWSKMFVTLHEEWLQQCLSFFLFVLLQMWRCTVSGTEVQHFTVLNYESHDTHFISLAYLLITNTLCKNREN